MYCITNNLNYFLNYLTILAYLMMKNKTLIPIRYIQTLFYPPYIHTSYCKLQKKELLGNEYYTLLKNNKFIIIAIRTSGACVTET